MAHPGSTFQVPQTYTPLDLTLLPSKEALCEAFVGKKVDQLRTPALVVDRAIFARNCSRMHQAAKDCGASFRAHTKAHKTTEGTRMQLVSDVDSTRHVVVSTLMEAWSIATSDLVKDGLIDDIVYGFPVAINKLADLQRLRQKVSPTGVKIRLLIDHPDQVDAIESFNKSNGIEERWSAFVKMDSGNARAGLVPSSSELSTLLSALISSTSISIYGFYCHAGQAYASTSLSQAGDFLIEEIRTLDEAAGEALALLSSSPSSTSSHHEQPFVLSVGAAPTTRAAAAAETRERLPKVLNGKLELHAGNYPFLDLHQIHTTLVGLDSMACKVLSTVISLYPGRGAAPRDKASDSTLVEDEAMCDAGGIAMSKDQAPIPGYGWVTTKGYEDWMLGRVSQEHGILTKRPSAWRGQVEDGELRVGQIIEIVGQHSPMTAAAHPWYYIVDSVEGDGKTVVDVWVPWKGW